MAAKKTTAYSAYIDTRLPAGSNTDNFFEALNMARAHNNGRVVNNATGQTVFSRNDDHSRYHVYQFLNYYGSYPAAAEAIEWARQYDFSRVIDNYGNIVWQYYSLTNRHPDMPITDVDRIQSDEVNNGGFFMAQTLYTAGIVKIRGIANLSQLRWNKAGGETPFFVFGITTNKSSYEINITCDPAIGKWIAYNTRPGTLGDRIGSVAARTADLPMRVHLIPIILI